MASSGEVLLSVRGLQKAFGGLVAVRDLSFDIRQGGITGLIGPNGSGKTTVLNLITGELRPDRGAILFKGGDIFGWPAEDVRRALQDRYGMRSMTMAAVADEVLHAHRQGGAAHQ